MGGVLFLENIFLRKLFLSLSLIFSFVFCASVFSEEVLDSYFGYSLDVPEGFSVVEHTPDGMSYLFKHENAPVFLLLKIYTGKNASSASECFDLAMSKLGGKHESDKILWRNVPCVVSMFDVRLPGNSEDSKGWGVGVPLPEKDAVLVLLSYTESSNFDSWQQFILSTLNSLSVDTGSFTAPGIIASYAYPDSGEVSATLEIAFHPIRTRFGKDDSEASRFVRDMEFSVFSLYANHPKWKEAWIRYYRAVFRDSVGRLKKASFDIYSALYSDCEMKNPKNPMVAMNEILLGWVQTMPYARETFDARNTDFTDLVSALQGKESDCDSRSLLMCALLRSMGEDTAFFVSREYSHAVYGILLDVPGAKISVDGKAYLLNETTAKGVAPGLIEQSQSQTEKWIPVTFR